MLALRAFHALADLVFPPRCLVCHAPPAGREHFCERCDHEIFRDPHLACPRCAGTVGPHSLQNDLCATCRQQPPPFDAALRLSVYAGAMQHAVLTMKHAFHEGLAERLGRRFADAHHARLTQLAPDIVVPVPLHWRKRLARGYNQSAALAYGLAKHLGVPSRPRGLVRIKPTAEQRTMESATARRENVKGAFRARGRFDGLRVLLVDDVVTTGATAGEAARALKIAGAGWVGVATLARP